MANGFGQLPPGGDMKWWQRIFAPTPTPGMDPNLHRQITQNTMRNVGLGLLSSGARGAFGQAPADVIQQALQSGNQAAQSAYQNQLQQRQFDAQERLTEQRERRAEAAESRAQAGFDREVNLQEMTDAALAELEAAGDDPLKRRRALEKLAVAAGPQTALSYMTPPEPEEFTLGQGDVRFRGSQPIASVPARTTPDTSVTLNTGEKIPESILKVGIDSSEKADLLTNQVNELSTFRDMAMNAETGPLTPVTLPIKQAFQQVGITLDENVPLLEAIRAQQNQMALRLRNPESGFGLTGNTSNQDVRFLKEAVAGLANTPEGNQAILTIMLAKQRREAQLAQLKSNYVFETGTLAGWGKERDRFIKETPLFMPEEQELLTGLQRSAVVSDSSQWSVEEVP